MIFKDLLLCGWEDLVTNWTIQTNQVLLLHGVLKNMLRKFRFARVAFLGELGRRAKR